MSEKLLPCPYCKAKPIFINNFDNFLNNKGKAYLYIIRCSKCGKVSVSSNYEKPMYDSWNILVKHLTKEMEKEVTENDKI